MLRIKSYRIKQTSTATQQEFRRSQHFQLKNKKQNCGDIAI